MVRNCNKCGVELCDDNWNQGAKKKRDYICKECQREKGRSYRENNPDKVKTQRRLHYETNRDEINAKQRLYREENRDELNARNRLYRATNRNKINARVRVWEDANPDKVKASRTKHNRKNGHLPMSENKECSQYLGIHKAERLLKHFFDDVEVMPYGHPGYDFVCKNGKKIDVKSSCTRKTTTRWSFIIDKNTIADYFWCVAFDNREDLNILHIWMLPGDKFNHLTTASISESTLYKWSEYEKPIDEAIICWNEIEESG